MPQLTCDVAYTDCIGRYRMKQVLNIEMKENFIAMISGITFARTTYWFPYDYKDLKMDLLLPLGDPGKKKKRPVILWFCGGGWLTMERSAHIPFLTAFAKAGYIVASAEYRLAAVRHFPAQIEDAKKAVRFLRAHADEFGIDPDRIIAAGESAGGCLATLIGVTSGKNIYDVGDNLDVSSNVSAVLNFYGPGEFIRDSDLNRPYNPEDGMFMGYRPAEMLLGYAPVLHPEEAKKISASHFVDLNTPPFFIIHGTADPVVPVSVSEDFCELLDQNHVYNELYEVAGATHADPRIYQSETVSLILRFLDRVLH